MAVQLHANVQWLSTRPDTPKVSSDLATIELLRTCRCVDKDTIEPAIVLLGGIDLLPMDRAIVERAALISPSELTSLDAIHLVSALSLKVSLTAVVTYDARLCSAAKKAGIEATSPA